MRILALDQGTTSTRILERSDGTAPRILHAIRHAQHHPHPGWCEQDPEELLANIQVCLDQAGTADALAIANQGESCLAWDAVTGRALTPVITWQDRRTAPEIEQLTATGREQETLERAGLPLDAYFSASKLGWIIRESAEAQAALRGGTLRLGTTDAFFLDRLAGVFATDITTASRTALMNLKTGEWDEALCALFGVPIECLPEIRPTIGDFGAIRGMPVRASAVDQQAALWGHGCRQPGDAKITFGTGAFALAVTGETIVRAADQGLLPTIAWGRGEARTHAVEGGVYDAGSAVEWARSIGILHDFAELDAFDAPPAISRGLAFVPALSGLACPHWDRSAAAMWIGMSAATARADLVQALLEGIALRAAEVIETMDRQIALTSILSVDGGLTRSSYFCQFLADITGLTIQLPAFDELTALGCAQMARSTFGAAPDDAVLPSRTFKPHPVPRAEWRGLFSDAVQRSRAWR
ncbi:MAG: glycerol kinase [Sphingomonadales bacterium]|nr:MAG: glycerol kinase [Sphingomonadales bacterium]